MKNLLLASVTILIILNTLIGLLVTSYLPFNYLLVDSSLVLTTVLIYLFSNSNISAGFKIGLTVLFCLFGLLKTVFLIIAPPHFTDNGFIITVLTITVIEILCLMSAFAMKKFA